MRILLGSLVAAVALAGAAFLHSGLSAGETQWRISERANDRSLLEVSSTVMPGGACNPRAARWHNPYGPACTAVHHDAGWQIPLAVVVAVAGVGAGVGIILR